MDGRSLERATQLLSTAEGQAKYLEWLNDETTQLLLAAAKDLAVPKAPAMIDASAVLFEHGRCVGGTGIVSFLCNPLPIVRNRIMNPDIRMPKATYGVSTDSKKETE